MNIMPTKKMQLINQGTAFHSVKPGKLPNRLTRNQGYKLIVFLNW